MEFVSYAQNYEDVILWRALGDVKRGFYVDVGAGDPVLDSVTLAFYERGWSGLNIEPLPELHQKLQAARPRDTNLQLGAAQQPGCRPMHHFNDTGLSTLNYEIAEHCTESGRGRTDFVVPVLPLATIFADQALETVHFLKVAAKGAEQDVLSGMDLRRWRPWIVLVEPTQPNRIPGTRHSWERLITEREYFCAYFDGLNYFYVARERSHLKEKICLPPNAYDNFIRSSERTAVARASELETAVRAAEGYAQSLEQALKERDQLLIEIQNSSGARERELQSYAERLHHLLLAQNERQEKLLESVGADLLLRNELLTLTARLDSLSKNL
ncbi:MAG: FkbM family methyltransferase, partial [Verrucomicrobia bacterium]|nr:FkbM family methyltransferase [Verrucomicrobiota bacterium]